MFGLGILEILVIVFLFIFVLLTIIWLRALIDILRSEFRNNNKIVWLLTVILVPFLGALIYFAIGKKQKIGA
jgi:hypothetical protein